jgi:hypothetical protein
LNTDSITNLITAIKTELGDLNTPPEGVLLPLPPPPPPPPAPPSVTSDAADGGDTVMSSDDAEAQSDEGHDPVVVSN